VLRKEGVFRADYLAFEIGCEGWVVFCQACSTQQVSAQVYPQCCQYGSLRTLYAQISAEERFSHINVLDLDLHVVDLALGLLGAMKFTTSA
jgi:hypothetical protein